MAKRWKRVDLAGGGLQSANLLLAQRMKRRSVAYACWTLFPLGAHRFYLADTRAWAYPTATALALLFAFVGATAAGWAVGAGIATAALWDLLRIDRRVTAINKQIRMEVYLRPGAPVPRGFRGRFIEEPLTEDEKKAQGRSDRPQSFTEQEELLRQLAGRKQSTKGK